ncbi:hypothetical protein [Streptomyces sp. NPDC002588]|uniref:hypothetical protein n=1 Tax=Streptomyces sp. NPDC002588 TaxID=3154419 RepID=UPI003317E9E5
MGVADLVVEPAAGGAETDRGPTATAEGPAVAAGPSEAAAAEEEGAQAAERRTEIADLTRRVAFGTVLTLPVLFAVMAHELFGADWVPGWMLTES